MGLLDRHKRKQSPAAQPASAPAAAPAAPAPAQPAPLSSTDSDSLRDMLIAAVATHDLKLLGTMAVTNREAIAANFGEWQKVPEPIRNNGAAMQRYANTLVALAELFRDRFEDMSLVEKLSGPGQDAMEAQWQQGLAKAEELAKELRFDDAKTLLTQMVAALEQVPADGPVPYHAVTHGRLGHTLFSMGEPEAALVHMRKALESCERRADESGMAAGLRGMYDISRYLGRTSAAAEFGDRLSALLAKKGNAADSLWWAQQSARTRAGEPPCRVVFFVGEQQYEVDEVPPLNEGQVRYGFVRNRPPMALCEGYVQRGMQFAADAKFDQALGRFREAAKVDPHDPNSHYQAAATLMHLQQPADAVAEYDETEKRAPGWFNTRSERWVAAEIAAGRVDPALFFLLRTEEMPDSAATWDQKLNYVDQALASAGPLPPLLLYKARCLMRLGRIGEAQPVLRTGVEKATEPDVRTRLLLDLQMITQDMSTKRRLLNEAITLNGNLAAAAVARVTLKQLEARI